MTLRRICPRHALLAAVIVAAVCLAFTAVRMERAETLSRRGWDALRTGNAPAAVSAFMRAINLRPGCHDALRGLGETYLSLYRGRGGDPILLDKAAVIFKRAVAASPADVPSRLRLLHIDALRAGPGSPRMGAFLDEASSWARGYPRHADMQMNFLALAADVAALPGGTMALGDGQYGNEINAAARFLVANNRLRFSDLIGTPLAGWLGPGNMLILTGTSAGDREQLASDLVGGGRWDLEGRRYLAAARSLRMKDFPRSVARALAGRGRRREAVGLLLDHLKENPKDAEAHFAAADISFFDKSYDWSFSEAHYRLAFTLDPGNAFFRKWYGRHLYYRGQDGLAIEELAGAVSRARDDAEAHFFLGQACERAGRNDEARGAYRRAAELDPGKSEYLHALAALDAPVPSPP